MKKYETFDLDLDDETLKKLKSKAENLNMSLDRFVELLLENYLSERVTKDDLIDILQNAGDSVFKDFYILVNSQGKAIAKVVPYED